MNRTMTKVQLGMHALLRGDAQVIGQWLEDWNASRAIWQIMQIVVGAGLFGAALGFWRAPLQAVYAGIKLPLIMLLTAGGNALLNAMLAPLLGFDFSIRQSLGAVITSFALASVILGSLSPVMAFVVFNLPPLARAASDQAVYTHTLLTLVLMIGIAGVAANLRLYQLLRAFNKNAAGGAQSLLYSWLGVNLLLGSQISWLMRPFIGSPALPVTFLRAEAMHGSFFGTVFALLRGLFI